MHCTSSQVTTLSGCYGGVFISSSGDRLEDTRTRGRRPKCIFKNMEWGYSETNGPHTWFDKYPAAKGVRQSPVDVSADLCRSDQTLDSRPLKWQYQPDNTCTLNNTGYCWKVDVDGSGSELTGGPLASTYKLEQFHAHWGTDSSEGSEHTVEGKSYAGELHLVHWNSEKYSSFSEAAGQADGLAVLGVLWEVGDENAELQKVISQLEEITHKGQKISIEAVDPALLLPERKSYWTYLGSLTTPPCYESVTWILFKQPVQLSENQLNAMRRIRCYGEDESCPSEEEVFDGQVVKNYRPPLPLGDRVLRECGE